MADRTTTGRDTSGAGGTRISARAVAGLTALALLIIFLLQNLQQVRVNFLWFHQDIRLIYALLLAAAFGGVATIALGYLQRRREDRRANR